MGVRGVHGAVLALLLVVAAVLVPSSARAGDLDRQERIDRAWQAWLEASAEQSQASTGDVVYDARIGALLGPSTGERNIQIFDFSAGVSGSQAGCASLGLVAELQEALTRFPQEFLNFAEQTVAGLVRASPMIALAYFKPTFANYIKHMRAMIHLAMNFRANQCGALNALIDKRLQDVEAAELKKCIDRKIKEGMSGHDAQDACAEDPPGFDFLPKMLNPKTGRYEFRPVEYGLTALFRQQGMSEEDANDYARIISGYFGDLVFTAEGEGGGTKGRRNPDIQEGLTYLEQDKVKKWRDLARKVLEACAGGGGAGCAEALNEFRTPHTRLSEEQYQALLNHLGPEGMERLLAKLADLNARLETLYQVVGIVEKYLQVAADQEATSSKDKIAAFADNLSRAAQTHLGTVSDIEREYREVLANMLKEREKAVDMKIAAEEGSFDLITKPTVSVRLPLPR